MYINDLNNDLNNDDFDCDDLNNNYLNKDEY